MMRNLRTFSITSVCLLLAGCMGMASDGTGTTTEATRGNRVDASAPQPDGGGGHTGWNDDGGASHYRDAEVDLDPVGQGRVNGEALFLGRNGLGTMTLLAGGFAPASSYTVEIHQNGTCHDDAMNIGPLWSAGGALANLGSVTVDAEGVGTVVRSAAWTLGASGVADPIGHSLVVVDAQQKPIACGVIWR
jgi:hypothetical protein